MATLGVGTVQFGMNYGISNTVGQTTEEEVANILRIANSDGIQVIDTAHFYGESEKVLGKVLATMKPHRFRLITKTYPLKKSRISKSDAQRVITAFNDSLQKLGLARADGLLLHRVDDLLAPGGDHLYSEMVSLKQRGHVKKIGASFYTPDEVDHLLGRFEIDLVQVPVNILNQAFIRRGHLKKLKERGIEIHVRSAFVQGLICIPPDELPQYFSPIKSELIRLGKFLREHDLSIVQGALCFLNQQPEIDVIVLGLNNSQQLRNNLRDLEKVEGMSLDFSSFSVEDEKMISPVKWPSEFQTHIRDMKPR